jgi:tetratricopeptide (TPR) repeat protein
MDVGPCRDHYEKAIQSYQLSNHVRGLAQVLVEKTRILFSLDSIPWGTLIDLQPLEDVLAALGDAEPALCGSIAAVMAEAYRMGGQPDKAEAVAQHALDIAQRIHDDSLRSRASHVLALAQNQNMKLLEAVENWQNALTYARRTDDLWYRVWPLQRLSWTLMQMAKLEDAETIALDACDLAQKTQDWGDHSLALAALVSVAVTRGEFDLAEQHGQEVMIMMHRSRYPWGGARALFTLACARLARGDWTGAESALQMLAEPGGVFEKTGSVIEGWIRVYRQLVNAYTGGAVEATVEQLTDDRLQGEDTDLYNLAPLCALVEIADLLASPLLASRLYPVLARAMERGVLFSSWWVFLLPRILGVVATLNGWWDRAEAHFQTALDVALRVGAKPELGRTYLDYARLLVARDGMTDRQHALECVRHAAPIFAELGMHPFISQTHQLSEVLQFAPSLQHIQPDTRLDDFSEPEVAAFLHIVQHRTSFLG